MSFTPRTSKPRHALRRSAYELLEPRQMLDTAQSVGGTAWHDIDRDGYRDDTDPPLAEVRVALYDIGPNHVSGDADDFFVAETTSGADGRYEFVDVPAPRTYSIRFAAPAGYYVGHLPGSYTSDGRSSVVDPATATIGYHTARVGDVEDRLGVALETPPEFGAITTLRSVGSQNNSVGNSIARDEAGNVYVAGTLDGTIDFDPTLGILTRTSGGPRRHAFIASYTPEGAIRWAQSLGGTTPTSSAQPRSIAVVPGGGVVVAGDFLGGVDFDPGEGVNLRTSLGDSDVFVAMFDASGNIAWVRTAGAAGADAVGGLAVDASGNIVTGGAFTGTVDFNPDTTATSTLVSAGGQDAFLWNLTPAGALKWAKAYRGSASEMINGVAIAPDGGVVSTGVYGATTDFNPGAGFLSLSYAGGGTDIFIAKLDTAGNYVFAKAINTTAGETAEDIAVDGRGNIYVTGKYFNTTDFDPGPGTYNVPSGGDSSLGQLFALKLDAAGGLLWARGLMGRWATVGETISVDAEENVSIGGSYVAYFGEGLDFDPGPGEFLLRPSSQNASIEWRLTAGGEMAWARFIGNALKDLVTDDDGNVYALMALSNYSDVDPGPGKYYALGQNASDIVIVKYAPPAEVSGVAWNDLDGDGLREDGEPPVSGVELRLYDSIDGVIGDDNDGQFWPTVVTAADGSFRFRSVGPGPLYIKPDAALGRRPTLAHEGTDPERDSDVLPAVNRTGLIHIHSGDEVNDVGFGLVTIQPVPNDDSYSTSEDLALRVPSAGVLGNDERAAGSPVTVSLAKGPLHGTLDLSADGAFTYVPNSDFHGTDRFSYLVRQADGAGLSFVREHRRYTRDAVEYRDELGRSVATAGDFAVAGAPGDRGSSAPYGSAYIYRWNGETWAEHEKLLGLTYDESFGTGVDLTDDVLAITSEAINSEIGGRLFIYRRQGQQWRPEATLAPADPMPNHRFGRTVSVHGDTIAVSATDSVYIFRRSGGVWSQQAKIVITAPYSAGIDAIALHGDTLAVGNLQYSELGIGGGGVHIYQRSGATWSLQTTLRASDASNRDDFGRSVAIDGGTLVVGAPQADENTDSPGAAYVFERGGDGVWRQTARLKGNIRTNYGFGHTIDLEGDVIAVGNQSEESVGAVYVYQRGDGRWPRQAHLVAADRSRSQYLGRAVSIGEHSVMTSGLHDGFLGNAKGAVYFFDYVRGAMATATISVTARPDAPQARGDVYSVSPGGSLSAPVRGSPPGEYDAFVMTAASWFRIPEGATLPDANVRLGYLSSEDRAIAADPVDGKVYWTDAASDSIKRSDPSGENVETVVSGVNPRGLAIDPVARRIYWTYHGVYGVSAANLDGTGIVNLNSREPIGGTAGLAIDPAAGHLYYTNNDAIRRVNVDGTAAVELINSGIFGSYGIALDMVERKMYWTERNARLIRRANLDGSEMETVMALPSPRSPYGIAIDPVGRKLYWSERGSTNPDERVLRSNLDGGAVEVLVTDGFNQMATIALLPTSSYATATVIPGGSAWRYLDNGSNPGTAWRLASFNDTTWKIGHAELGLGDGVDGRPEVTQLIPGPNGNGHAAYYFRRTIGIPDVSQYGALRLDLKVDDGAVVYINGSEVLRTNMPSGTITSSTLALEAAADDGAAFTTYTLPTTGLLDGVNVIAVEVHQSSRASSDLSFDLRLTAIPHAAPRYGVLGNDLDPDSTLAAELVSGPYRGTLSFQPNGAFVYTPDAGFQGVDQFTYRADDGASETDLTLVTINVGNANVPPVAIDDSYLTWGGRTLSLPIATGILANDFDMNADLLTASVLSTTEGGTLTLNGNGAFTYAPAPEFVGEDSFTYRVSDGTSARAATATIQVLALRDPINGVPLAADDAFAVVAGDALVTLSPGVLNSDADPEGSSLTAVLVSPPWHGTLVFDSHGGFSYTPNAGFTGTDTFLYRASDGNTFSLPKTVTISVTAAIPLASLPGPSTVSNGDGTITSIPGSTSTGGVTISADVNLDGRIDRADLAAAVGAYASTRGSLFFSATADINADGGVSLVDVIYIRNAMPVESASSLAVVQQAARRQVPQAVDRALVRSIPRRVRRETMSNTGLVDQFFASATSDDRMQRRSSQPFGTAASEWPRDRHRVANG